MPGSELRRLLDDAAARLAAAGIEGARAEAALLLAEAMGRTRADLLAHADLVPDPEQRGRLAALVARRAAREPMAYLLGRREFWSLEVHVTPDVLVPRPETETVVEAALVAVPDRAAPLQVLDLGTGSGCLLLALLSELPHAHGLGVDRSRAALAVAEENARRLGLADRARFRAGDWGRGLEGSFGLVVSNPPYVTEDDHARLMPEVRNFEPEAALRAGPDGLDAYRALAPDLPRLMAPGGTACLELGRGQAAAVGAIMRAAGLHVLDVRPDLAGIARCLVLRATDERENGRRELLPKSCADAKEHHIEAR